ncbi:MAG: YkvA family protein [Betaproteobacteria bacterium]
MWQRIKSWARTLKSDGMTLWFCCRHPQMPWLPKIFALLVVGYFLSPIDLIPDFIPVLGYLDELILLPGCIYLILRMVPPAVLTEARAQATQWIATHQPRPRSIVAAIVIMLLWMIFFSWLWQRYGAQLEAYFSAS